MFLVWVRTVLSDTHQFAGDGRPVELAGEQPQHVPLASGQRLDEPSGSG